MLTRLLPILILFCAITAPMLIEHHTPAVVTERAAPDSLEATLTDIEKQSWVAWQHHDGKFFEHFLSDDHVEVGTNGIATKAQVVAYVGSAMCIVKSYTVDHFHATRFNDNTALLTYRAAQETTCGKVVVPSPTWVSSLFVRRSGHWMNALYQHTREE
jgi:hypothetical protein